MTKTAATNLKSMTGFGRGVAETPGGTYVAELKSVNGRFGDARVVLPHALSALEARVREILKKNIKRGKIDCRVKFTPGSESAPRLRFDETAILDYIDQLRTLRDRAGVDDPVTLEMVLRLPGAVTQADDEVDNEAVWPHLEAAVQEALTGFEAERAREGKALAAQILSELTDLRGWRERIATKSPEAVERFRERLSARIEELESQLRGKLDEGRLEIEVAMHADRSDVSEEVVRLEAHFDRLEELVANAEGKPVGKALDFLIQEILREVNTTGSKLREVDIVGDVLEMKGAVERIREQVQNIE